MRLKITRSLKEDLTFDIAYHDIFSDSEFLDIVKKIAISKRISEKEIFRTKLFIVKDIKLQFKNKQATY